MIIQSSLSAGADSKPHFGTAGPRKFIFPLLNPVYFNSLPSSRQKLSGGGNRCLRLIRYQLFLKQQAAPELQWQQNIFGRDGTVLGVTGSFAYRELAPSPLECFPQTKMVAGAANDSRKGPKRQGAGGTLHSPPRSPG